MPRRSTLLSTCLVLGLLAGCENTGVKPDDDAPTVTANTGSETDSELAQINTQLGYGYLREGQLDLAWKRLSKALEADPGYSTAHNAMGLLYVRLGDSRRAEEHFEKAVSINPGDSAAQTNFGSFLC